ncbi:SUN domain-containing protein [Salix suchowensis]|nr:SUN domain-containing protein [Salix suchowensis]
MLRHNHPFASDRFRLPPEGHREYATSSASPRRRLCFEHPAVAFIFGIVLTLIAKQLVNLHSTIMVTLFLAAPSPFTPNPQPTNPASASVSPSIHHSLLAGATYLRSSRAHSVGVLRSSLRWVRDTVLEVEFSRLHMSRPRDALSENMELGRCWEFEGSAGHIAIELPDVGTITHVSVAYVPVSLLSQAAAGRAPRGVTIWSQGSPGILPSDRFIRLGEFVFDINASLRHQFFAIDPDATTVKTSLVVVEVNSNHGSSTTCLYYLGSRVYSGNNTYKLAEESLLLTQVSLVGWPHSERTYVEVLYTDDSGQECVCHFGALVMHKDFRPRAAMAEICRGTRAGGHINFETGERNQADEKYRRCRKDEFGGQISRRPRTFPNAGKSATGAPMTANATNTPLQIKERSLDSKKRQSKKERSKRVHADASSHRDGETAMSRP